MSSRFKVEREAAKQAARGESSRTAREVRPPYAVTPKDLNKAIDRAVAAFSKEMEAQRKATPSPKLTRGEKVMRGVTVAAAVFSALALAGVVQAYVANERDNLATSFTSTIAPCASLSGQLPNVNVTTASNFMDLVVTNRGRQPITIVQVSDGSKTPQRFVTFKLTDPSSSQVDVPVEIAVGQAVGVRFQVSGSVLRLPLKAITSDGREVELQPVNTEASNRERPAPVQAVFEKLPRCDASSSSPTATAR